MLLGELDDNPSTSLTNGIEAAAKAVSDVLLQGDTKFRLYEYVPRGLPSGGPTFYVISWRGGRTFRWPEWVVVKASDDPWLAKASQFVNPNDYTSKTVDGKRIDATVSGQLSV